MSIFAYFHSIHDLHQLKKALPLLREGMTYLSVLSFRLNQQNGMVVFVAPVSHCGELAFFIVDARGMLLYAG